MKLFKGDRIMQSVDKHQLQDCLDAGWSRTKETKVPVEVLEKVEVPEKVGVPEPVAKVKIATKKKLKSIKKK
ncbi:MAG: hypothetical protein P9L97_05940 [Candidatus Tenebribacter davisii]|nr:hypothetical protein [Candidatus Tenebribacter davisii]